MSTPKGTRPWNAGTSKGWTDSKGYRWRSTTVNGRRRKIREHRWVMENHIGRVLEPWEVVHHINGEKSDNRIENLEIQDFVEHTLRHHVGATRRQSFKEIVATYGRMKGEIKMLRELNADLYAALAYTCGMVELGACNCGLAAARAALAKARGEA